MTKRFLKSKRLRRSNRLCLAICVAGAALPASTAQAQVFNPTVLTPAAKPPPPSEVRSSVGRGQRGLQAPADADKKFVTVRSVSIAGAFPELAEQNDAFMRKLRGQRVSLAQIYQAAAELQAAYGKEFPLATLSAPRPDFAGGDVRLTVADGVIERLELKGVQEKTAILVRERLDPLIGKRHLTASEYQRRTLLVGTISGVAGQIVTTPGVAGDGYVLNVGVVENRVVGSTVITNRLPKEFGTWEFAQSFALNNAAGWGEQLSAAVSSGSDFDRYFSGTSKNQAYSIDFGVPIGADGFAVSAGYLSARSFASPLNSTFFQDYIDAGERQRLRFDRVYTRAAYPLILRTDLTLRAQAAVEHINNRYSFGPLPLGFVFPAVYGLPIFETARDQYTVARFSSETKYILPWFDNASFTGLIAYSHGLGGRSQSLDPIYGPLLSKFNASPVFDRLNLKGRLDIALPEQFILSGIGRYQTSFGKPLMIPENFILDGPEAVSGYASGTINADRGVTARGELTRPFALELLGYNHLIAPYIFGAWGSGVREDRQPGQFRHVRVQTFGGGVRADTNFLGTPWGESLAIEFGRDLSNIPFRETGYRTNFTYSARFVGDPFLPDAAPAAVSGVLKKGPADPGPAPALWQGAYAGLNAGYTWDPRPEIETAGAPLSTGLDQFLSFVDPQNNVAFQPTPAYWDVSSRGVKGRSLAAGGGYFGGGQIGYNFQINKFVLGVEADLQGSNARTRRNLIRFDSANQLVLFGPGFLQFQSDDALTTTMHTKSVDWLGTVRGRLGYLIAPTLLGYGAAGFAYGGARASSFVQQNWSGNGPIGSVLQSSGASGQYSGVRAGWSLGAGFEWMFAPNASVKAEYIHYDLGTANYAMSPLSTTFSPAGAGPIASGPAASNVIWPVARTQFRGDIGRIGLNYHFGQNGFYAADAVHPAAFVSGFYAGLNAGYNWDAASSATSQATPLRGALDETYAATLNGAAVATATGRSTVAANGALGGGQAGYNYVVDNYLGGVEADIQGAAAHGAGGFTGFAPFTLAGAAAGVSATSIASEKTLDWFGTLRARAGYLVTPSILAYATGGFAYGGMTLVNHIAHVTEGAPFYQSISGSGTLSTARVGWTLGGGLEWKFSPAMSLKAEYLYYDLGRAGASGFIADSTTTRANALAAPVFYVNTASVASSTRFSGQIARLGLNYHFDPAAAFPLLGQKTP